MRLEVAGQNGDPLYYKTSMKHGVSVTRSDGIPLWEVIFDDNEDITTSIPNFVETVAGLELRLNDIVMTNFNQMQCYTYPAEYAGFDRSRDDKQ